MFFLLILLVSLVHTSGLRTLAIAGAAGRVGRQLINELISNNLRINGEEVKVKALVRDISQLSDVGNKIEVVQVDISCLLYYLLAWFYINLTYSRTYSLIHSV